MLTAVTFATSVFQEAWHLLREASVYMLFGLLVGGLLKAFLSADAVARHLGSGKLLSVFKAALLGIPIPLCSCGVLPAAAALKKQGANTGATTAFLIATPESGVDSISITYALLDPLMTVARPLAAFLTAFVAGISENLVDPPQPLQPDPGFPMNCLPGTPGPSGNVSRRRLLWKKIVSGMRYAVGDLWGDLAIWFFSGLLIAGVITVLVPDRLISAYLGGGIGAMLLMLAFGIPLYICATASTPIAAALILKGVSPGAALVFLLVGPATNITSLAVLLRILGKRATGIYLTAIAVVSVLCGLALDRVYAGLGIQLHAAVGQAAEVLPAALKTTGAVVLLALGIRPLASGLRHRLGRRTPGDCGCAFGACSTDPQPVLSEIKPLAACGCSGGDCNGFAAGASDRPSE